MAEEQRAPGHDPVDVALAIDVLEIGALAATYEQRLVEPDRVHRADGRVHAAGNEIERAAKQFTARLQSQLASSLVQ